MKPTPEMIDKADSAAVAYPVGDWTVDDTETAGEILTLLGIGCDASKEPGADWRRDKIARIIASRISQQDAELDRLREALKPFALAATIFEQEYGDRMKSDTGCNIKFAVLCQARAALRSKAEETRT